MIYLSHFVTCLSSIKFKTYKYLLLIDYPGHFSARCNFLPVHVTSGISYIGGHCQILRHFRKLLPALIPALLQFSKFDWIPQFLFHFLILFCILFVYLFSFISHVMVCQFSNFIRFHFPKCREFLIAPPLLRVTDQFQSCTAQHE